MEPLRHLGRQRDPVAEPGTPDRHGLGEGFGPEAEGDPLDADSSKGADIASGDPWESERARRDESEESDVPEDDNHELWGCLAIAALVEIVLGVYLAWGRTGRLTVEWGLLGGAGLGAVLCVWLLLQSEVPVARRRCQALIAVAAILLLGLGFWGLGTLTPNAGNLSQESDESVVLATPPSQDRGQATWEYWQQVYQIGQDLERAKPPHDVENLPEWIANLRMTVDLCRQGADRIAALSPRGVDAEVVVLAADYMQLIANMAQELDRLAQLAESKQQLDDHAVSLEGLTESFVRGFLGDPLGKARELDQTDRRLDAESDQLLRRFEALETSAIEFRAQSHRLRGRLCNQYQRDFPMID